MAALKTADHQASTGHPGGTTIAAHRATIMDERHLHHQKAADDQTGVMAVIFRHHPVTADINFLYHLDHTTALMVVVEEEMNLHRATHTYPATKVASVHAVLASQTIANSAEDRATRATHATAIQTSADPIATTGAPATLEDLLETEEMGGRVAGARPGEMTETTGEEMMIFTGDGRTGIPKGWKRWLKRDSPYEYMQYGVASVVLV
jgi:hypothetical protein